MPRLDPKKVSACVGEIAGGGGGYQRKGVGVLRGGVGGGGKGQIRGGVGTYGGKALGAPWS